jgi:hypothetical protein
MWGYAMDPSRSTVRPSGPGYAGSNIATVKDSGNMRGVSIGFPEGIIHQESVSGRLDQPSQAVWRNYPSPRPIGAKEPINDHHSSRESRDFYWSSSRFREKYRYNQ